MLPIENIVAHALQGIVNAQDDYEDWSECWLWEAPEYLVTTYIAREISKIDDRQFWMYLEYSVRQAINDAGGLGSGRPPNALRLKGKFDIVLWDDDVQTAVIEVKNQVHWFSEISADIERICVAMNRQENIQLGLVAFYTSKYLEGEEARVGEVVEDRMSRIVYDAEKAVKRREMNLVSHATDIQTVDDSAWAATVLQICP